MKKFNIELTVGFFLLLGILSLAYISINLGKIEIIGKEGYTVLTLNSKRPEASNQRRSLK